MCELQVILSAYQGDQNYSRYLQNSVLEKGQSVLLVNFMSRNLQYSMYIILAKPSLSWADYKLSKFVEGCEELAGPCSREYRWKRGWEV